MKRIQDEFTKKQLLMSLFCPLLTLFWGSITVINDLSWGADFSASGGFRYSCFAAVLSGGILPVILTVKLCIHTEKYFKKRLLVIIFIYVANSFIGTIGVPLVTFIFLMIFDIGAVVYQIVRVWEDETSAAERFILIISDPIVYWMIYWFIFYFDPVFKPYH